MATDLQRSGEGKTGTSRLEWRVDLAPQAACLPQRGKRGVCVPIGQLDLAARFGDRGEGGSGVERVPP